MIAMAPPRPSSQHGPSRPTTFIPQQAEPDPAPPAPLPACRFSLSARTQAAAEARGQLHTLVCLWGIQVDIDVLVLLASELITNAVTHAENGAGAGVISVCVRCLRGEVRVEVHDGSHDMPVAGPLNVDDEAETGRGLMLVDTLAAEWGFYRTPGGKAVYFTLPSGAA
ncbi:MAG TPA: ATP-binding protein [Trebonia sp.]|nr:ATP-binding protein [Trebonia sp.]